MNRETLQAQNRTLRARCMDRWRMQGLTKLKIIKLIALGLLLASEQSVFAAPAVPSNATSHNPQKVITAVVITSNDPQTHAKAEEVARDIALANGAEADLAAAFGIAARNAATRVDSVSLQVDFPLARGCVVMSRAGQIKALLAFSPTVSARELQQMIVLHETAHCYQTIPSGDLEAELVLKLEVEADRAALKAY